MRTTLNIEDGLLRRLKREAELAGRSLTEMVNRVLRLGVEKLHPETPVAEYRCPVFSMGFPPEGNPDKALGLAATLEDEETVRKLNLRKGGSQEVGRKPPPRVTVAPCRYERGFSTALLATILPARPFRPRL